MYHSSISANTCRYEDLVGMGANAGAACEQIIATGKGSSCLGQEAINTLFCPSQEKLHTVVSGFQKYFSGPVKSPYEISPANLYLAHSPPPETCSR